MHRRGKVPEVVEPERARDVVGEWGEGNDRRAEGQVHRPAVRRGIRRLDAGHGAGRKKSRRGPASSGARKGRRTEIVPGAAGVELGAVEVTVRRAAIAARSGSSQRPRGSVSLNWRMLAKPLANAISRAGASVVSIRIRAVWAALRSGKCDRPGADLGDELTVQVTLAVLEAVRQTGDPLTNDYTVRNEPHRSTDQVGALVPFRRPRRGVGPAPLAGPEAGELGRGGGRVEPHVRALRRPRRAARPAVDASAGDGTEEPAVEAGVPAQDSPVALLRVLEHGGHAASPRPAPLADFGRRGSGNHRGNGADVERGLDPVRLPAAPDL